MNLAFYTCRGCGKWYEEAQFAVRQITACQRCGTAKFSPNRMSDFRMWVWLFLHPSYLIAAIREK